jgi:hypothetical protein
MADPSTLARDLSQGVTDLSALAARDLEGLWLAVQTPGEARDALLDVLPSLVGAYSEASAALAADWYDNLRDASSAPGRFSAIPADLGDTGATGLARWALGPVFTSAPDWQRAKVLVEGGVQKRIANAARYTVAESAVADPGAQGWQRVGDGNSCPFCLMLIGRGTVYSRSSADFASHEFCGCMATPAFLGEPIPVKPFRPGPRQATDADRNRVDRWIAENL